MDQAQSAIDKLLSVASTVPEPGTRPSESGGTSQSETSQTGGSSQDQVQNETSVAASEARPSKVAKTAADQESSAYDSISSKTGKENTSVSENVAPAVEHETVTKQHETREQTAIEKERHQDHYHTTVQPLKDREVLPTQEDHETAPTQYKEVQHEGGADIESKVKARNEGFEDTTTQGATEETKTKAETVSGENVHHHLHETVQPVIEKETVQPSVTHKTIPVKERHQDVSQDEGTTVNSAISKEEFQRKLDGESTTERGLVDGKPDNADEPTVS